MSAPPLWRRLRLLAAGAAACAAIACGVGGTTAGIEGTGVVSSGAISGFGSVFVNGVEFATNGASILVNGQPAAQTDLQVGEVVTVVGKAAAGALTGTASTIQYFANVQGPVEATNLGASTFTVLGQTVTVGSTTTLAFAGGGTATLANLSPGTPVVVSGFAGANGTLLAARIDILQTLPADLLSGVVAGLNTATAEFSLGGVTIDYGAAVLAGFPGGRGIQAGDTVQVTGAATTVPAPAVLHATALQFVATPAGGGGSQGEIDGLVTRFASTTDFDVAGAPVTTNAGTAFFNGAAGTIALGVHLRAQGVFEASGTLLAAQINFDQSSPVLVQASVESVDAAAGTLQVLGIAISTSVDTRFDDQGPNPVRPFNLAALRVGDTVSVRGTTNASNGIDASGLTRIGATPTVELRGIASVAVSPNLTVLGIGALTSGATQYRAADGSTITSQQFYAAAPGAIVDLSGNLVGSVLQVQSARLPGRTETGD